MVTIEYDVTEETCEIIKQIIQLLAERSEVVSTPDDFFKSIFKIIKSLPKNKINFNQLLVETTKPTENKTQISPKTTESETGGSKGKKFISDHIREYFKVKKVGNTNDILAHFKAIGIDFAFNQIYSSLNALYKAGELERLARGQYRLIEKDQGQKKSLISIEGEGVEICPMCSEKSVLMEVQKMGGKQIIFKKCSHNGCTYHERIEA